VRIKLDDVARLRFEDSSPVRAASALARLGPGWLVAQDDATQACWLVDGNSTRLRLLPPVHGLDTFSERAGSKQLKPDLEAAFEVSVDGQDGVLLLGSGSTSARMRSALVWLGPDGPTTAVADLSAMYSLVRRTLDVSEDQLNLEGACSVGDRLRLFNRGLPSAGLPSARVDLDLAAVVAGARGGSCDDLAVLDVRRLDLGEANGAGLAVTDAASLGGERVLVSAAAEDSPNTYDDGPVVASALVLLDDDEPSEVGLLPLVDGRVAKVEGLALLDWGDEGGTVLAVVDADDPDVPSSMLRLRVELTQREL